MSEPARKTSRAYSHYVLLVLVIVYVFNFIDRNILSILAEDIKADLGASDAQLGRNLCKLSINFIFDSIFCVVKGGQILI